MIKFNYILNDLALSSLITKCLYSENANYCDKEELENQIKLIQQENKQLKEDVFKFVDDINKLQKALNEENLQCSKYAIENEELNKKYVNAVADYETTMAEKEQLKANWNKLKDFLEEKWQETQDIWYVKIINKMREIENGSSRNI